MRYALHLLVAVGAALCVMVGTGSAQAQAEKRIALVIGNAAYQAGPIATPANDAGLVAQTLQAAGFDVVGARDLDEDALRRSMRDFVDKAAAAGPDTVAFVYLAGYGLQLAGENYFAPVDAGIATAAEVPARALRLSDYTRRLDALPLKARFVVLDAARTSPFARSGEALAGGLALVEAAPGSLVAFNAAPGTVGPVESGSYGAYAQALVEMIRDGGLAPAALFDRVRLRVGEATKGAEIPWDSARIEAPFLFLERAAAAPTIGSPDQVSALRNRPLRDIGARDAYALCVERDTLESYGDFVAAYPTDAMTRRVRAIIAARREALTWRRSAVADTPDAYWSYLDRYPRGPHAPDARWRLRQLAALTAPPAHFAMLAYDLPPPPPDEIVYVERPALFLDDPVYALPPPPPPSVFFLAPRPAYIVELAPPPPPVAIYALPTPLFVPVPSYVAAPAFVAPPTGNVLYQNIHNTTVINQINERSLTAARGPVGPAGAGGNAAAAVALPPALAQRAALRAPPGPGPGGPNGANVAPGAPGPQAAPLPAAQAARASVPPGQPLPGSNGQPLPPLAGRPATAPQAGGLVRAPALAGATPATAPLPAVRAGGRPGVAQRAATAPGTPPPQVAMGPRDPASRQRSEAFAMQRQQAVEQRRAGLEQRRAAQAQRQQQVAHEQSARGQVFARQQQAAAQRQQMMQARAPQPMPMFRPQRPPPQQQQAMQRPPQPQPQRAPPPHGGGGPHCHPGQPCR